MLENFPELTEPHWRRDKALVVLGHQLSEFLREEFIAADHDARHRFYRKGAATA